VPGELSERAREHFAALQERLCRRLEQIDGRARFGADRWSHAAGGGGFTRVLADGAVIEKGGVNLSAVRGRLGERIAARLGAASRDFSATGISVIVHPRSPMVPTAHMNLRYLELYDGPVRQRAWFGGGADLTPYYLFEEDAAEFHRAFAAACAPHACADYPAFKRRCDEYFHLRHRGEARGVGGIFFDDLDSDLEAVFAFARDVGEAFLACYPAIVERRRDAAWGEAEKTWQLIRRGRYVEFNLIADRGTLFGLETGGRTESILVSMPPAVRWVYDHRPAPGSRERALLDVLERPRDWV